jgi:thiosulfate/3-mercaptopyruvate sulfurtransferase
MFTTLISPQQLAQLQSQNAVVILDCRFDLMNTSAGEQAYAVGHIPGALYAHLDRDLSGPITPATGRHPLPTIDTLAATLGQFGIDNQTQVVAYDANNGMTAARAWWLLRWLGHDKVAVLSGGLQAWIQAGMPLSPAPGKVNAKQFVPKPRMDMLVTMQTVAELVNRSDWRVLDARAPERYRGEVEPIDPVAGHIPGAKNYPFVSNLNSHAELLASSELQSKFAQALDHIPSDHVVAMCGSGVTACHLLLAMQHAGLYGGKLYAGSWSEWIRDANRPVAKGN